MDDVSFGVGPLESELLQHLGSMDGTPSLMAQQSMETESKPPADEALDNERLRQRAREYSKRSRDRRRARISAMEADLRRAKSVNETLVRALLQHAPTEGRAILERLRREGDIDSSELPPDEGALSPSNATKRSSAQSSISSSSMLSSSSSSSSSSSVSASSKVSSLMSHASSPTSSSAYASTDAAHRAAETPDMSCVRALSSLRPVASALFEGEGKSAVVEAARCSGLADLAYFARLADQQLPKQPIRLDSLFEVVETLERKERSDVEATKRDFAALEPRFSSLDGWFLWLKDVEAFVQSNRTVHARRLEARRSHCPFSAIARGEMPEFQAIHVLAHLVVKQQQQQ